jgi:hypothetical protein
MGQLRRRKLREDQQATKCEQDLFHGVHSERTKYWRTFEVAIFDEYYCRKLGNLQ